MSSVGIGEFSVAYNKGGNEVAVKVRSRWRSLALVLGLALLVLAVPAQAITPTFVGGSANCATVGSAGTSSFSLFDPIRNGTFSPRTGVTITLTDVTRTSFNFSVSGAQVYDLVVKGSGSNWYDYDGNGAPVTSDTGLVIPNGNKLNALHFCYSPGVPITCNNAVTDTDAGTTASFTRVGAGDCSDGKRVILDIANDIVTFIPIGGTPSTYTGVLTFTKGSTDANALVLLYDPDDSGPAPFKAVPDCVEGSPPSGDTWCVVSASGAYQTGSSWVITWNVNGVGDPLFK